ncbi:hypothetical protein ARC20_06685 [Stenotrophomonas panacihumi]|uniref:3-dehydroquinate dehydratase n=1 Tax=Stenotrophomonas panacihumi TaxID=676599 RepID=A0A0R0ALC8_9GAMM|nr:hypothetical protein [Stenotrophomonas panacihumi]KRG46080.1 hypothetical protein ARC20_06685 [Stenotrophomonas panacihumi]PTN56448.1 hypothetical protein C9J98_01685 [Stenotrophomonas panacihumi]
MSVLILQGPSDRPAGDAPLPAPCAGHATQVVHCADIGGLIAGLHAARHLDTELVLLDSGHIHGAEHRAQWSALRAALDGLAAPYIEVHDDPADELQPWLRPNHLPIATIITAGDRGRAYALSSAIAARRLDGAVRH